MKVKIGSQVGNWLVKSERFKKAGIYWNECECICGVIKDVREWHLNNSKTKGCGCTNIKTRFRYEGIGDLSKSYYNSFKSSRVSKGIVFSDDVNMESLYDLFIKQNKLCALSGVDIVLNPKWSSQNNGKDKNGFQTASIDRIDNSLGYTLDNIQWVHKDVNYMRGGLSVQDFVYMCKKIADNNLPCFSDKFNGKRLYFGSTNK
jgi:hypothetical protein